MYFLYLSGGFFLGWSLGANDAANVFGTAVATGMVRFRTAAIIASVFVILGALIDGAGAAGTVSALGTIKELPAAFTVSLAAAATVTLMTKLSLPVSTSQAIIGAVIGWNIFAGYETDLTLLSNIVLTWILSPVFAAIISIIIYLPVKYFIENYRIHLLAVDSYTRSGLFIAGAIGAYSLGANNIANVVGVFMEASPFTDVSFQLPLMGGGEAFFTISGLDQLLFIGALAVSAGIITYSYRVMKTVGSDIFHLSPITALIVVSAHSFVLYLFASEPLRDFLISHNLPALPLVPVSSSQAIIGAIVGIAIAKGSCRALKYSTLAKIASGWITTPLIAAFISWFLFSVV